MYLNGKKIFATLNNKRTLPIVVGGGELPSDEYHIILTEDTGLTVKFLCNSIKDWGDGTSGSENTHTYSNYGSYTIRSNGELANSEYGVFTNGDDETIAILTSVKFVNSRLAISCFYGQDHLEKVTFSGSETSIPKKAFCYCEALQRINIPNSVSRIEDGAFLGCRGLTSIPISNNVTYIGKRAFDDCQGLTSITIPTGVEEIDDQAFTHCYSLANIYLTQSISYIGSEAFYECNLNGDENLDIYYSGTISQWNNIEKSSNWSSAGRINITVHCTDGDIN